MTIRVALAEDSAPVREALTQLLREEPDLEVVAVCCDGEQLRAALAEHEVDVVLTDVSMPPSMTDEGIRIAAELRRDRPELGVVVLTAHCDAVFATALLEAGPERRGYLLKQHAHSGEQLTATIKAVADGGSVIDPDVVRSLLDAREREAHSPLARLSPGERDVLGELAHGSSATAIAEAHGRSTRGVERDIHDIFDKLALPATPDASRRVRTVLLFLAEG